MIGREMGVPLCHGQGRVTKYFLERLEVPTPHHEPRGKMVPSIVEAEVFQLGLDHGVLECGPDTAGLEYPTLTRARQARQGVVHHLAHGNLTPLARLRLLQPDDATAQVHPVPSKAEQLALPEAGLEGDGDELGEFRAPRLAARGEEPDSLGRLKPADPTWAPRPSTAAAP